MVGREGCSRCVGLCYLDRGHMLCVCSMCMQRVNAQGCLAVTVKRHVDGPSRGQPSGDVVDMCTVVELK